MITIQPGVIQVTDDDLCELCGEARELRPYGRNGENICYECGMKDEATTKRMFDKFHDGQSN